jgi:uncharacterized protein
LNQEIEHLEAGATRGLRPDPMHQINSRAVTAWRISGALGALTWFLIPGFLAFLAFEETLDWWIPIASGAIVLGYSVAMGTVVPKIRWERWRYQIEKHEIYLKFGIIVVRKVLIPVARIQNVDTRQGPIYRYFGLSSVTITTAATTHEIPALDDETADQVRDTISRLAREYDIDV